MPGSRWRGAFAVAIGRVVPVARTFISFPAGVAEMPLIPFGLFTALGVTVWVGVLTGVGYSLGSSYHSMVKAFGDASYVVAGVAVAVLALGLVHRIGVVRAEQAGHTERTAGPPGAAAAEKQPADSG